MIQLDPRTVIFINFIYTFCISLFISSAFYVFKDQFKGFVNWLAAFLLLSLNFLMISFKGIIPVSIVITLPHLFAVWAYIEIKRGLTLFYNIKNRIITDFIILSALAIALIINDSDARLRLVSVCLASIAVYADTILLFSSQNAKGKTNHGTVKTMFSLAILVMVVRLILGMRWDPLRNPLDTGNSLSTISLLYFVTNIIIFFCLLFIAISKILEDRNRLIRQIRTVSLTDELTGLMNRRGFKNVTNYEANRFTRTNKGFTIALGDIDFFKRVNDEYGHDCGDRVIKRIGEILIDSLRNCDTAARWGGEEFVILFPETNEEEAQITLNRIRIEIERTCFECNEKKFNKTISFGACYCDVPRAEVKNVINRADMNLYNAKNQGRNTIVISSFPRIPEDMSKGN